MPQSTRILIVEDDKFNVRLLSEVCRNAGYTADVVMDGLEALAVISRHRPDLILLDLMIPSLDGFGVLERLRGDPETAEVPVILVTAIQDREARARGIELGADDWIGKPFKIVELQQRIQAALQMRAFKRQLSRDLTPPAGRVRPRFAGEDALARAETAVRALRESGQPAQVVRVEFSTDGPAEVGVAVREALAASVADGPGVYLSLGERQALVVLPMEPLAARRAASAFHAVGAARRRELGSARPRLWWGVGADATAADAACRAAREADLEPELSPVA